MLPLTLDPNTAVDIEILYTPVVEGLAEATFTVFSDDPNDPYVTVNLIGEGMPVILSPEEQITQILDFYDQAVEEGSIEGVGNKKFAKNKARVFGKMLTFIERMIDRERERPAVKVLEMIEKKCDGKKRPKDFIEGPAVEELNTMINELIDTLKNNSGRKKKG